MGPALNPHDDTAPIPVVVEASRARHAAPPQKHGVGWWSLRIAREVGIVLGIAIVASIVIRVALAEAMYVPTADMEPTLQPGDRILVTKGLSAVTGLSRGDVVAFRDPAGWVELPGATTNFGERVLAILGLAPAATGDDLVMRVIGTEGDRVACCTPEGKISINDTPLDEPYLAPGMPTDQVAFDVVVPTDSVFVMGDNRAASRDSRYYLDSNAGGVPTSALVGRAVMDLWPPGRITVLTTPEQFSAIPDPGTP